MRRIYELTKSIALRYLPDALLRPIKRRHYFRLLENFDIRDEPDLQVLPPLVVPGTTVVDIGANIGVYTKFLSRLVSDGGRVVSIEPVPDTFQILRQNVRALGLANVSLLNAAVSASSGTATMLVPQYASGGLNFYESRMVSPSAKGEAGTRGRQVDVRTTTLDEALSNRMDVSFIKCDVEGHEHAVLAGAEVLLRRCAPAWLIEISENPDVAGTTATQIFAELAERGYDPWLFDGTRLRPRRRDDRSTNYFFLTPSHIERIHSRAPSLVSRV